MAGKKQKWTKQDLLILCELRKNARTSLVTMARNTNIPTSSVFDKVYTLSKKLIYKHVTLLDFSKIGYGLTVHYIFSCAHEKLLPFLLEHKNINTLSQLQGNNKYFVEAIFPNMLQARNFEEGLQKFNPLDFQEHFIAEEISREQFFTYQNR